MVAEIVPRQIDAAGPAADYPCRPSPLGAVAGGVAAFVVHALVVKQTAESLAEGAVGMTEEAVGASVAGSLMVLTAQAVEASSEEAHPGKEPGPQFAGAWMTCQETDVLMGLPRTPCYDVADGNAVVVIAVAIGEAMVDLIALAAVCCAS